MQAREQDAGVLIVVIVRKKQTHQLVDSSLPWCGQTTHSLSSHTILNFSLHNASKLTMNSRRLDFDVEGFRNRFPFVVIMPTLSTFSDFRRIWDQKHLNNKFFSREGKALERGGGPSEERGRPLEERRRPLEERRRPLEERGRPLEERGRPLEERGRPLEEGKDLGRGEGP